MEAFDDGLRVKIVRAASFSAAHRYYNPNLSEAENRNLYGSLYRQDGFGHNFLVEAHFSGPIDPMTGMIVNLDDFDRWIKSVITLVDHKRLNDLPAFETTPPTPETIARFFFTQLEKSVSSYSQPYAKRKIRLENVRVYEGSDTWADFNV